MPILTIRRNSKSIGRQLILAHGGVGNFIRIESLHSWNVVPMSRD